ncbi:hypothetical protein AB0D49_25825 [Streptomyces sp. NPDC048290]|uniref:hypothetical protein n=1 Tax=Streptomyces sp. NPDC048290 TaxID=3155811 RepID=UPI00343B938B
MTLAILLATVTAGTACSSSKGEDSEGKAATTRIHLSRAVEYTELTGLAANSSAVVKVTAGTATGGEINGVPTTVTEVRVTQLVSGEIPGDTLSVQQFGNGETIVENSAPILKQGNEYLLFVRPFHFEESDETGLHSITGGRGEYVYDKERDTYRLQGGEDARIPPTLSSSEIAKISRLPLAT